MKENGRDDLPFSSFSFAFGRVVTIARDYKRPAHILFPPPFPPMNLPSEE